MQRLFVIILIFIPSFLIAQFGWVDGFIVRNTGDTIPGKIYYSPPGHRSAKILFKEEGQKEKVKYRPFMIRGYFVKDQYFISRIYDINPSLTYGLGVFMRLVNHGEKSHVKVYEYWNTDREFGYNQTFLVKSGGSSYEINPLKFKKSTAKFFKDFPELHKDINKGMYSRKDLMKIVERYNAWRKFDKWNKKYDIK